MKNKNGVFTPGFIGTLFVIAGIVFLYLKGQISTYMGDDGLLHEGDTLFFIGVGLVVIGVLIWLGVWIHKKIKDRS